jgi:uncharacterized membrane protein YkvA (DUF1232 family)
LPSSPASSRKSWRTDIFQPRSSARGFSTPVLFTPSYAKALAICVVAYAFSPIDLIPDPIPVLGYLDDLIVIPLDIALTLRLIPDEVMADARAKAVETTGGPTSWIDAILIALCWISLAVLVGWLVLRFR